MSSHAEGRGDARAQAFAALGAKMEDYVEVKRVQPAAYRAHFGDHTSFDLTYDMEQLREQVDALEEGAGGKFIQWLGKARASLDLGIKAFIESDSTSALDFVNPNKILDLALAVNPLELLLPQARRRCARMWRPLLRKANVVALLHTHRHAGRNLSQPTSD